MSNPTVYCFCGSNCKYETMTKEQILAAIAQAAETGLVFDVNAAFISQIKEKNSGAAVTLWVGTQAEYNRLTGDPEPNCLYIIKDEKTAADLARWVEQNFVKKDEAAGTAGAQAFDSGEIYKAAYTAAVKGARTYMLQIVSSATDGEDPAETSSIVTIDGAFLRTTARAFHQYVMGDGCNITGVLDAEGYPTFTVSSSTGNVDPSQSKGRLIARVIGYY